jgi:hypothetical protein
MLAVIGDENAPQARRDQMAIAAAPFCHPRLSAITTNNTNVNFKPGEDVGIVNIFSVPRGARIEADGKAITIDGAPVELETIRPFVGTPPLELPDQSEKPAPIVERIEVTEIDVSNVTPLRRRDDNEPGPGAA